MANDIGSLEIGKWYDEEASWNDRVIETFISADEIDKHGDRIKPSAFAEVLPWLCKFGYYEYGHSGFAIGKMIGWRFAKDPSDGKVKPQIRVCIHKTEESNIPQHDQAWKRIKQYGEAGMSSINGFANIQHAVHQGGHEYNQIDDIGVFAIGFVEDDAANSGANISFVSSAKAIAKSREYQGQFLKDATGEGVGVGGEPQGEGGTDYCYCPVCKEKVKHVRGTPCNEMKCPKCGGVMTGVEIEKKFADYEDFADCVSQNKDKDDPEAYCASIEHTATGKWPNEKSKNEIIKAMNSDEIDKKIESLKGEKKEMQRIVDDYYKNDKMSPEVERAQERRYELDNEIQTYLEAKIAVVVGISKKSLSSTEEKRMEQKIGKIEQEMKELSEEQLQDRVNTLESELEKIRTEKAETEKSEFEAKISGLEKAVTEKDKQIEELEAKMKQEEEEEPPGDDEPAPEEDVVEEPDEEIEEIVEDIEEQLVEVETNIETLAEAIESLEPGTPEAVEEAVELAEQVKVTAETIEAMKEKASTEQKKRVGIGIKKLGDTKGKLFEKLGSPITKGRQVATQRIQKAGGRDMFEDATKAFNEGKGDDWWKEQGFNRRKA